MICKETNTFIHVRIWFVGFGIIYFPEEYYK